MLDGRIVSRYDGTGNCTEYRRIARAGAYSVRFCILCFSPTHVTVFLKMSDFFRCIVAVCRDRTRIFIESLYNRGEL
jgi:hypothetical protein